jgi:L-alanine-DL-glutamate epimerase-like enolase superfamily enzyme
MTRFRPEDFADNVRRMAALPQKFSFVKQGIGFHSGMKRADRTFHFNETRDVPYHGHVDRGLMPEKSLKHLVACVAAMKEALGDEVGLALDCGPGMTVPDAIRFARAVEPYDVMWCEDMITGDYVPWVNADVYREVTVATSTPIHTGEQIYLRQNFKHLIESHAVRIVGPDPCDVGGIAELKWVAEYADLHGIQMAPHGTANGLLGVAALVQVCATLPDNYIAFELPWSRPGAEWWHDILEGLPDPVVRDGFIDVWDAPGLGVVFNVEKARPHLDEQDRAFFD